MGAAQSKRDRMVREWLARVKEDGHNPFTQWRALDKYEEGFNDAVGAPKFQSGLIVRSNLPNNHPLRCRRSLWRPVFRGPIDPNTPKLKLRDYDGEWGYEFLEQEKDQWKIIWRDIKKQEIGKWIRDIKSRD